MKRWKAMERVVGAARKFVGVVEGPYLVENIWYKEMFDALAALDRTEKKTKGKTKRP